MPLAGDDVIKWIYVTDADLSIFVMFFNCIACRILRAYSSIYIVRIGMNHFEQVLYIIVGKGGLLVWVRPDLLNGKTGVEIGCQKMGRRVG